VSAFKFAKFCHVVTVANVNHYVDVCLAVIKMFAMFVDVYRIVQFLIVLMDLMEIVIAVEIILFLVIKNQHRHEKMNRI